MKLLTLILAIVAFALSGCAKKADWHQKMVLYFDTPDGPMTASSVIRVDFTGAIEWAGDLDHDHTELTGEAVVADLGGRFLFALLDEGAGRMIVRILPPDQKGRSFKSSIRWIKRQTEPLEVPKKLWPRMVTFKDINDPTSIQLVNPENLNESFGPGYRLRQVTIQTTKEPITSGRIEAVFSWWNDLETPIGGPRRPFADPLYAIGKWDFIKG